MPILSLVIFGSWAIVGTDVYFGLPFPVFSIFLLIECLAIVLGLVAGIIAVTVKRGWMILALTAAFIYVLNTLIRLVWRLATDFESSDRLVDKIGHLQYAYSLIFGYFFTEFGIFAGFVFVLHTFLMPGIQAIVAIKILRALTTRRVGSVASGPAGSLKR